MALCLLAVPFALASTLRPTRTLVDPPYDLTRVLFSGVFTDGAVLQRAPASASVFGTATVGASVTVHLTGLAGLSWTSAPVAVQSGDDPSISGTWRVIIPPQAPGFNYSVEAACKGCTDETSHVLTDLAFGDVYLCSGQSNMECPVLTTLARNESYIKANASMYDHIRLFQVGWRMQLQNSSTWILPRHGDADDGGYPMRTWMRPRGPGSSLPNSLERFSATCWYFGKSLSDLSSPTDGTAPVPIGLISSTIGGTSIQEWLPPDVTGNGTCELGNCGYVEQLPANDHVQPSTQQQCTNATQRNVWSCSSGMCSSLWYTMISPYVNYTIAGVVWYQGENNIFWGRGAANSGYQCQQAAMISSWRKAFSATPGTTRPDFPFGITSLAGGCTEGFPLWSQYQHASEDQWLKCATGNERAPPCKDMVDDWAGAFRVAQTGGFGFTPNTALPNVFFGQGYDQGEPCICDRNVPAPHGCWANDQCYGYGPFSLNITWNYELSSIHPRVKHVIGLRLARSLFGLQKGTPQPTPKLAGCRLSAERLVLSFDAGLLGAEAVSLQAMSTGLGSVPLEFQVSPANDTSSGWVRATSLQMVNDTSIAAYMPPGVGAPFAVRYAWGDYPCCPEQNASTFFCPPTACPIVTSETTEPAVPFWAFIEEGRCRCEAPWSCEA